MLIRFFNFIRFMYTFIIIVSFIFTTLLSAGGRPGCTGGVPRRPGSPPGERHDSQAQALHQTRPGPG